MTKIKDPCIEVCQYDDNQVCIGCRRTKKEAKSWWRMDDKEKLEVLGNIKTRRPETDYYGHYA